MLSLGILDHAVIFVDPFHGIRDFLTFGHPWTTVSKVDDIRCFTRRHLGANAGYIIIPKLDRAYFAIIEPVKGMQIAPRHEIDLFRRQVPVSRMFAIPEDKARPILAVILQLNTAVHLIGIGRRIVIMLDAHHGIALVAKLEEVLDIGEKDHIAIHEQGPTFVFHEMRDQKARVGKFRREGFAVDHIAEIAAVGVDHPGTAEYLLVSKFAVLEIFYGRSGKSVAFDGIFADFGGYGFSTIEPDKDVRR